MDYSVLELPSNEAIIVAKERLEALQSILGEYKELLAFRGMYILIIPVCLFY